MITLSEIQEQARDLRALLHRAQVTKIAEAPTHGEIDELLAELEIASNDDCDACDEVNRASNRLRRAIDAMAHGRPDVEELRAAFGGLLFVAADFSAGEAREAVAVLCQVLAQPAEPPTPSALPLCFVAMGCLCAGHARGNPVDAACDTNEKPTRRRGR